MQLCRDQSAEEEPGDASKRQLRELTAYPHEQGEVLGSEPTWSRYQLPYPKVMEKKKN